MNLETSKIIAGGILLTLLLWSLLGLALYFLGSVIADSIPEDGLRGVFSEMWCGSKGCESDGQ